MANTEGLPDEFVESLMRAGQESNGSDTRRSSAQRRFDMPKDGRPAAKVIRSSPQVRATTKKKKTKGKPIRMPVHPEGEEYDHPLPEFSAEVHSDQQASIPSGGAPNLASHGYDSITPLVGSVIERADTSKKLSDTTSGKRVSAFRSQRQGKSKFSTAHAGGFPSVHVPLGTFVKTKKTDDGKSKSKRYSTSADSEVVAPSITGSDMSSLEKVTQHDAQSMIDGMSQDEIQESIQEINSVLSPEMREFIRKRGARRKRQSSSNKPPTPKVQESKMRPRGPTRPDASKNDAREKERLATLLSSVRTMADLDTLYAQEMKSSAAEDDVRETIPQQNYMDSAEKDFYGACGLLRSSSPRQALWSARVISQYLHDLCDNESDNSSQKGIRELMKEPWADVLPVSLRCILDQTPHTNGYILHAYTLQSLYSLLKLCVDPSHVIRVHYCEKQSESDIYRNMFLDDSHCSSSMKSSYAATSVQPLSADGKPPTATSGNGGAVAYSTTSSSTSAKSDAQSFVNDPMWTLLSRMRIVPRISELLDPGKDKDRSSPAQFLPREGLLAICGILAMIAQRSPGAATMIAHHPSILPSLYELTIHSEEAGGEGAETAPIERTKSVYSVLVLLYTLARQSRVAAGSLNIEEILPRLLASMPADWLTYETQRMGLSIWRVCLRYGLALEGLSTMMALAASHLALDYSHEYSLSTEFISCFTVVIDCIRAVGGKTEEQLDNVVSSDQLHALSIAYSRLVSTCQQVIAQLFSDDDKLDSFPKDDPVRCRWIAARLHFLATMWNISGQLDGHFSSFVPTSEESKTDEPSQEESQKCLGKLFGWMDEDGLLGGAWGFLSTNVLGNSDASNLQSKQLEASSSSIVMGLISLFMAVSSGSRCEDSTQLRNSAKSISMLCSETLISGIRDCMNRGNSSTQILQSSFQDRWINRGLFAVAKFLSHSVSAEIISDSSDIICARTLVFVLIGRLKRGDESMAAILFSQDSFFQSHSDPLGESPASTSPISSMFLSELCGSEGARNQLDHSFKLNGGLGITKAGIGAFKLQSMSSYADQPNVNAQPDQDAVLPLRKPWLWKTLAGSIHVEREAEAEADRSKANAIRVISATLSLIVDVERESDTLPVAATSFADSIPLGERLYYLTNTCLHNEDILRDESVSGAADSIAVRYLAHVDKYTVNSFVLECTKHLQRNEASKNQDELSEKDKKLLSVFIPEEPKTGAFSSEHLRAVESLVEDLAKAYVDYGAQYDFFTKCIRFFFSNGFPASIKCSMIRQLGGSMHLLTLPDESLDDKELTLLLKQIVSGGLPENDESERDAVEILNVAVSSLGSSRALDGFALCFFLSLLVRDAGIGLSSKPASMEGIAKRLMRLDALYATCIIEASKKFLGAGGSADDLVRATIWAATMISSSNVECKNLEKRVLEELIQIKM